MNNIAQIQNILEPCIKDGGGCIGDFCEFLAQVLSAFPYPCSRADVQSLYNKVFDLVAESLKDTSNKTQHFNALTVLQTICKAHPEYLDKLAPQLVKVIQRLTKDSLSSQTASVKRDQAEHASNSAGTSAALGTSIQLLSSRLYMLPELKKSFLQSLNLTSRPLSCARVLW